MSFSFALGENRRVSCCVFRSARLGWRILLQAMFYVEGRTRNRDSDCLFIFVLSPSRRGGLLPENNRISVKVAHGVSTKVTRWFGGCPNFGHALLLLLQAGLRMGLGPGSGGVLRVWASQLKGVCLLACNIPGAQKVTNGCWREGPGLRQQKRWKMCAGSLILAVS